MNKTGISWTDLTSNPLRYKDAAGRDVWACVKTSAGCAKCYSEALALRYDKGGAFSPQNMAKLTPYVRDKELYELLNRKKTPPGSRVFLADMTDCFGEWVPFDLLDRLFGVLAIRHDVTFQLLTKRPGRMADYFADPEAAGTRMLLANVSVPAIDDEATRHGADYRLTHCWMGASVEDQRAADERIPHLLRVPAAVKFLSCEPLLGPVDLSRWLLIRWQCSGCRGYFSGSLKKVCPDCGKTDHWCGSHEFNDRGLPERNTFPRQEGNGLNWIILGGESGAGARPMNVAWARGIVKQCQVASVPVFVKQLGGHPFERSVTSGNPVEPVFPLTVRDKKGGNIEEFPADLRVRDFPEVPT